MQNASNSTTTAAAIPIATGSSTTTSSAAAIPIATGSAAAVPIATGSNGTGSAAAVPIATGSAAVIPIATGSNGTSGSPAVGLANPSATYCAATRVGPDQTAEYIITTNYDGSQSGVCVNPLTGKYCDGWDMYYGKCSVVAPSQPNLSALLQPVAMPPINTRTLPINRYNPYPCGLDQNDWY